jgi:lipopolysaccharide biosynthesis protein
MKIGIFIHLFHTDLLKEFNEYINKVKNEFGEIFLIFTLQNGIQYRRIGETIIKRTYPKCHILYIENKGVDVYSFLKQIQYVREKNITLDYILKIHTKMSIQDNLHDWRKELIQPITEPKNLKYIHHIMKKREIGYVASQNCLFPKNFDLVFKKNFQGIYKITQEFPHINENYLDFVAGTMFWINYKIIRENITNELIEYLIKDMSHQKPPSNFNDGIYPEYVFERLITGPLCFDYTNILINVNKVEGLCNTNLGLHSPNSFTFYRPKEIMETIFPEEKNNLVKLLH